MFCAIFWLLLLARAESLEIVCGPTHNCVFQRGQEAMKCWGENGDQRLGYGDTNNRGDEANEMGSNLPLLNIGTGFTVEAMNLGGEHSCAMSVDRAMKCFGSNVYSQLGFEGNTTTGDALPFLEFGADRDFNLSKIAAGQYHTCVLSTDAALKCFGYNYYGQCGAGTTTPISGPPSQITAIDFGNDFTPADVSTVGAHVCALSQQQTVKCFGLNDDGQLGYGDTAQRGKTPASMGDGLPIVDLGSDFIVAAIATGYTHSCALSTTKTVKCWGCGSSWNYGQCGTPHSTETGDNLPVLEFGADFVPMQLTLGAYHTCILSETATLICFGYNLDGQLGLGSTTYVDTPSTLTGIALGSDFVPRQVAAGYWHNCAVSTNDAIKCWGNNDWGQLGLGHTNRIGAATRTNEMGDNLPFVDVCLDCSEAPTTAQTTTTTTIWTSTVAETTAASPSPSAAVASTSSIPTQTTAIIAACASGFFVAVVCICAAAFYYVRKNNAGEDRRQALNEIDNDAEVRVPSGVQQPGSPYDVAAVPMVRILSQPASQMAMVGNDNDERKHGEADVELEEARVPKRHGVAEIQRRNTKYVETTRARTIHAINDQ